MELKLVVLAKQVPDTKHITGKAMKEDGTVNRAALPTIFNPEDLNALEMALSLKRRYGGTVTVISMGPPNAANLLRTTLFMGADRVFLLSDRALAASDTLPTSLALAHAVKTQGDYDIVLCGRQAIDGDTAQVGPQCADKLGINQLTYVFDVKQVVDGTITCSRLIENGVEDVKSPLPVLVTVPDIANRPSPPKAKRIMKFKKARTPLEIADSLKTGDQYVDGGLDEKIRTVVEDYEKKNQLIPLYTIADIGLSTDQVGLKGSPTMVKKVDNVILAGAEFKAFEPTQASINALVHELIEDHTLG